MRKQNFSVPTAEILSLQVALILILLIAICVSEAKSTKTAKTTTTVWFGQADGAVKCCAGNIASTVKCAFLFCKEWHHKKKVSHENWFFKSHNNRDKPTAKQSRCETYVRFVSR